MFGRRRPGIRTSALALGPDGAAAEEGSCAGRGPQGRQVKSLGARGKSLGARGKSLGARGKSLGARALGVGVGGLGLGT